MSQFDTKLLCPECVDLITRFLKSTPKSEFIIDLECKHCGGARFEIQLGNPRRYKACEITVDALEAVPV